jgi:heme-degrading monooxygenase HmoA
VIRAYHEVHGPLFAVMVRATLHLKVRRGCERDFEHAWRDVAAAVGRLPGNLRQALIRDASDPCAFTITSDWVNAASFRAFEVSPEQDALTATLRGLRESAAMSVDALLAHFDGEAPSWPA